MLGSEGMLGGTGMWGIRDAVGEKDAERGDQGC